MSFYLVKEKNRLKQRENFKRNLIKNINPKNRYEFFREYDNVIAIENCMIYNYDFIGDHIQKIIIKNGQVNNPEYIPSNVKTVVFENINFFNKNFKFKVLNEDEEEEEEIKLKTKLRNNLKSY